MRSKLIWFMLTLSAVVALALFQPAVTYAGQVVPSHFAVASADSASVPATLAIHGGGGRHGGGWHGGGWGGRAFHGGGGWHGGRHFYDGGYYSPYYSHGYPYYVEPYCDTVWDSDLDQWVCADSD